MILLLTCSIDGTADLLVSRLGDNIFRFNYDLVHDYEIEFSQSTWRITDPVGRTISNDICQIAYWWKAFSAWNDEIDKYLRAEHKYFFRDLYGNLLLQGKIKGNPPNWHDYHGKMTILGVAKKYIKVPSTIVTMKLAGIQSLGSSNIVAKSLSSALTETNKVLFTTEVKLNSLHPEYLWYLQQKIESRWDVTVFLCGNSLFAFRRDRSTLKGIDWRAEQTFDIESIEWVRFNLKPSDADALLRIASDLNTEFGRFDLMSAGDSDELVFLEFNANGQWVFLDYHNQHGLLDTVVNWLTKGIILLPEKI
jgi:hypothetical protein